MDFIYLIKPKIAKRYLLFIAAILWSMAGCMLLFRGVLLIIYLNDFLFYKLIGAIGLGTLFYKFVFSMISLKYINRIINLENEKVCVFAFFSIKSYFLMGIMISLGIWLRKSGLISMEYFSVFYIIMGIPLLLSALRFYFYGKNYNEITNKSAL